MRNELSVAQRRQIVIQAAALLAAYTGSSARAAARLGIPAAAVADLASGALATDEVETAYPRAQQVVEGVDRLLGSL